jgi:hypothetical protein
VRTARVQLPATGPSLQLLGSGHPLPHLPQRVVPAAGGRGPHRRSAPLPLPERAEQLQALAIERNEGEKREK